MSTCKLIIRDEINIKLERVPPEVRRKISNKLKFELPHARHMPQYKLGRWDGSKTFFSIGGTGFINHLDIIIPILTQHNITIDEVEDLRYPHQFSFTHVTETYWADKGKVWPEKHPQAGQPILLRDYQVNAINTCIDNLQGLQELATGAGKTITCATLSSLCEPYGRTMIIVPNKSLVVQTEEDYKNVGLDVGVYFGDRKELNKTHTIVTWQSLAVLDKKESAALSLAEFIDGVNCVIVDECFSEDTKVLTDTGYREIKSIKEGDVVINFCEKTNTFKPDIVVKQHQNLTNSKSEDMFELEFDNGSIIQVTGNHKFLTTNGWIRADELTDADEIISFSEVNT